MFDKVKHYILTTICRFLKHKEEAVEAHWVETENNRFFVKGYTVCTRCLSILRFDK